MSKQMKSAYAALEVKDMMKSVDNMFKNIVVIVTAIALLAGNTSAFSFLIAVSLVAAGTWLLVKAISFLCDLWIAKMGFDEIELERRALA